MRILHTLTTQKLLALFIFIFAGAFVTPAQTNHARSMVTQPVNASQMVMLRGNVHPLARTEFDRGPAPATLPMENIQLVLKRSPEQEAALAELLKEQQDPSSPNYHKGVTPQEFGARFGASDHDIQAVTSWLQSYGLQILEVSPGRNIIQFSGTAAQVGAALQTSIHSYVVKGEQHWANASDPQIPAALADVVAGVNTLHNFHRKSMARRIGTFSRSSATGEVKPQHPLFSFDIGEACGIQSAGCFAVAPFDFATIYNVLPLWNAGIDGTGETIAIVGDSNINLADVANFRSLFGLPPNVPNVIIADNGTDPGIQVNGDELESDLDVQWAGGVAKGATIDFVIAANTNSANGVDLAAEHIINHNLAPVMSESFGDCELDLGSSGNAFFNSLWQMGSAEMITIVVSTGDNGSAACDFPANNVNDALPASSGLQVSGIASTPFNIAVGGTDFDQLTNPTAFWSTTNAQTTQLSAKGYIPETTWNDSCTNLDFILVGFNPLPEENCNTAQLDTSINPIGASGGVSNCTAPTGDNPSNCAGGYAKPAFQSAPGVPNDGKRDLPDVSLFAGDGLVGSFYVICEQDLNNPSTNNPCSLANPDNDTVGVGGTSASAQAFAGIMALVVQKAHSRQGIGAATSMYQLAAQQSTTACSSSASPAGTCVFNDVTKGTIAQPCVKNSTNCVVANSSDTVGILSGCDAAPGYDLATGLGSINAENLVNNFSNGAGAGSADFAVSLANCTSTITIPSPGGSGSFTAVITELNGFNSALSFTCAPMPSEATCAVTTTPIDATHISAKVTVTTTAASWLLPVGGPSANKHGLWTQRNPIILAFLLTAALIILLIGASSKNRRLSTVMALIAFATVITMAACGGSGGGGGGGGGGGNAGTPTGVSTPVLTATGGSTTHSLTFTLIVE